MARLPVALLHLLRFGCRVITFAIHGTKVINMYWAVDCPEIFSSVNCH
jgi:hypothetical protein